MNKLICLILVLCSSAALAQTQQDNIRKAQEMMNSPEVQQQLRESMQQMKAAGVDTSKLQMPSAAAMDAAMGMGQCVEEKVGKAGMEKMEQDGKAMHAKVQALCKEGKRDEAEKAAREQGMAMAQSKEGQAIRACAEKYKDKMNDPSMASMRAQMEHMNPDAKHPDICGHAG